ncbi:3-hydroxyacyl-ACP dehydratase [Terrimonas rubra]|uniref:3-hydroxyacyl-ACP dehydratase n=1 Tax=Terrimonas rubra TaxID=1035890 RepID=A0ABW6A1C4_9BACT
MLNNSFYQVINKQETDGSITLTVEFNAAHKIFEGHFPGQPVVPGVCMLHIIKEQLAGHVQKQIILREAAQVKYLNIITPATVPVAEIVIAFQPAGEQLFSVTATITANTTTYCKAKLLFGVV